MYVPIFAHTNLHPRVPDGPLIMLKARDLMRLHGVPEAVKTIFLDHAERWLCPINAAVVIHQEIPPILKEDLKKIRTTSVNTRALCWGKSGIRKFLTMESVCAPCLSFGSSLYWRSLDNHNRSCERYIGKMAPILKSGRVKDSLDKHVDQKVHGCVLNMENELTDA